MPHAEGLKKLVFQWVKTHFKLIYILHFLVGYYKIFKSPSLMFQRGVFLSTTELHVKKMSVISLNDEVQSKAE